MRLPACAARAAALVTAGIALAWHPGSGPACGRGLQGTAGRRRLELVPDPAPQGLLPAHRVAAAARAGTAALVLSQGIWKAAWQRAAASHSDPDGLPVTDDWPSASGPPGPGEPAGASRAAIDTTVPHSARIWNYWLGGSDNYAVDREAGEEYQEIFPGIAVVARTSREFLTRAVRYLAGEAGIRQFLDIGTGLPTADNTHEVAQRIAPDSKIVYVDNDPLVLAHARALLTSSPQGDCEYLDADIRNPDAILAVAASLLDFTQPVALMLMGIMGHFTDDEAYPIVARLQAGLPSGSYFALYDGARTNEAFNQAQQGYNETGAVPYHLRSPEQFAPFFEGLELIEPGMVPVPHWRPDPGAEPAEIYSYCGVGRKL